MAVKTIIDNQHARLLFDSDKKIIRHELYKSIDSRTLRDVLNGGVKLLKEQKSVKWLSDNRDIAAHSEADTQWINTDWLPRAIAAGWKYWALVVPHDMLARMNMSEFTETFFNMGVRCQVFTDVNEAQAWLERQ